MLTILTSRGPQNLAQCVSNVTACSVKARAEEGRKNEPPPAPSAEAARQAPLVLAPAVMDACHRADVAATLYQLLSNGLLMHHEMDSVYSMLGDLCPDVREIGFGGDGAGTCLAGALLRLKGREAAVLGSVMDRVFMQRREFLPALRSAFDFEVSQLPRVRCLRVWDRWYSPFCPPLLYLLDFF